MNAIGVLLVDDHAVVREGFRLLLERSGDVHVVGEAADAAGAVAQSRALRPDVVVMDIALPGATGIDAVREIRAGADDTPVLMFSMYEDAIFAQRALKAGAQGYVTKASAPASLVEAVRAVAAGRSWVSPGIARALAQRSALPSPAPGDELSPREMDVLRLLVRGVPVRSIAARLGLTAKTVANHQSTIRQKLGAQTAVQLLHAAARLGVHGEG